METTSPNQQGSLYIIPTPIGNLEDITLRALKVLKEVDVIAAEDTRHSRKLLNHFGLSTPLTSYYREKETEKASQLLRQIKEGKNIGLVSDAGTPGISDPGAILVQMAHREGISVVPLPGPSAATTAMSASGYTGDGFLFIGFLPSKKGQRLKLLNSLISSDYPVVLYESPRRVQGLLRQLVELFGDRKALWAREITKSYEELTSATLTELLEKAKSKPIKGEFVLIIHPGEKEEVKGRDAGRTPGLVPG